MVKIKLKWNKSTYDDVDVDQSLGVDGFKDAVYKLTFVPKDRQKLMAKGAWTGLLKDDVDFANLKIKDGQQVMLMGTSEVVVAPKEAVNFVEDMTVEEMAKKGAIIPAGLVNLGNTCYMNSTVECMRYMPELRQALTSSQTINLASLLRATYDELDRSASSIPPYSFVHNLRSNFPQFAEMAQGRHSQQDAEEFYNTLTSVIQRDVDRTSSPWNSLLGLELEESLSCQESEQESTAMRYEHVNKLVCNIQGGSGSTVNIDHLHEGLKLGLEGTIEKYSDVLQRNALWKKKQSISSLPRYICIQFMRFFWKATPESRDHVGVKCKILRAVSFPETLDVYDFCNPALQEKLRYNRTEAEKLRDAEQSKRAKIEAASDATTTGTTSVVAAPPAAPAATDMDGTGGGAADMDVIDTEGMDPEEAAALQEALKMSMGETGDLATDAERASNLPPAPTAAASSEKADSTDKTAADAAKASVVAPAVKPGPIGNSLPDNFTGNYELHAVVTHKGRSADSGHYIGWVRQQPGSAFWWCYDDDKVTEVKTEEIMKLCGGGDREMAYLNFYRFKDESR